MSFFDSMSVLSSGLVAEQTRMNTISDNIANINTTQTPQGGPYQRAEAVFQSIENSQFPFSPPIPPTPYPGGVQQPLSNGVEVISIYKDPTPGRLVYDPRNPLANTSGYVRYPNVDLVTEMSDMMSATRAYSANVTAINSLKTTANQALTIK